MKGQWNLILALLFTLLIAIFSVLNVESVLVNFMFVEAWIPLIIVIISATLLGGLIIGSVGLYRQYLLQREIKLLKQTIMEKLGLEELQTLEKSLKSKRGQNEPATEDGAEGNDQNSSDDDDHDKHIDEQLRKQGLDDNKS